MELKEDGFIRLGSKDFKISPKEKVLLIRKGNEFFNKGNLEEAKKVFITINYADGLIRLGDHYYEEGDFAQAMKMYILSKDKSKIALLADEFSQIVKKWIKEQ